MLIQAWKKVFEEGLREDGAWDWTTLGAGNARGKKIKARVVAKASGVWGAEGLDQAAMSLSSSGLTIQAGFSPSRRIKAGDVVSQWSGVAEEILRFERTYLNLACYFGGIATQARTVVDLVETAAKKNRVKTAPRVCLTRKTLPGYRDLAVGAVVAGGGHPHRLGLASGILIKENHIAAAGSVGKAIDGARLVSPHGLKIECEVRNLKELKQAVHAGAEGVLLDNFGGAEIRKAVGILREKDFRGFVEVSGGIHAGNVADYVVEGVHVISLGALTHSVKALDLSLLVESK